MLKEVIVVEANPTGWLRNYSFFSTKHLALDACFAVVIFACNINSLDLSSAGP